MPCETGSNFKDVTHNSGLLAGAHHDALPKCVALIYRDAYKQKFHKNAAVDAGSFTRMACLKFPLGYLTPYIVRCGWGRGVVFKSMLLLMALPSLNQLGS